MESQLGLVNALTQFPQHFCPSPMLDSPWPLPVFLLYKAEKCLENLDVIGLRTIPPSKLNLCVFNYVSRDKGLWPRPPVSC